MSIHRKSDPVGIDKVIDKIQQLLHEPLLDAWNSVDVYGRVYKLNKEGVSIKRYLGNGEYEKVLFSEGNKVFFMQGTKPSKNQGRTENDLWIICIVNVDDAGSRKDEEAHQEVETLLTSKYRKELKEACYGIEELKRLTGESIFSNFKFGDIHPNHVFAYRLRVEYYLTKSSDCNC